MLSHAHCVLFQKFLNLIILLRSAFGKSNLVNKYQNNKAVSTTISALP